MTTLPASIADLAQLVNVPMTLLMPVVQYQETILAMHLWRIAMGQTVVASSNGVVASAGDNVAVLADIVPGITGVDPHTWILYQEGTCYTLIDCDEQPSPYPTPQVINGHRSEAPYTGFVSTVNRPLTTPGYEISQGVLGAVPWTDGRAGAISYQYSVGAGIGWFWVKEIGVDGPAFVAFCDAPVAGDPMRDNGAPVAIGFAPSLAPNGFNTMGTLMMPAGNNLANTNGYYCSDGDTPVGPVFADNLARLDKVYMTTNTGASVSARFNGESRLFMFVTPGNPVNARNPADPVLDLWTWWTIGPGLAVLWLKTDGDIQ